VVSLVRVKKRSEDFNKAKLKASVKKAGAKDEHATKIADKIAGKVKQGTTTVLRHKRANRHFRLIKIGFQRIKINVRG
jgi:hypothetical protein